MEQCPWERARVDSRRMLLLPMLATAAVPLDEVPKACASCEEWNPPHAPFRLFGDAWYVGPAGLSSVVVKTSAGLVLLDGALPQSVDGIVANLAAVGLDVADIRYLLVSHPHYDHVGGIAALQRRSGATVLTTRAAVAVLGAEHGALLSHGACHRYAADARKRLARRRASESR